MKKFITIVLLVGFYSVAQSVVMEKSAAQSVVAQNSVAQNGAAKNSVAQYEKFDLLADSAEQISFLQRQNSKNILNELYKIAHISSDSNILLARALSAEVSINIHQKIADTSLSHRINKQLRTASNLKEKALLLYSLGINFIILENYANAFTNLLQALEKFKSLNETIYVARTLNRLGDICSALSLNDMSISYHTEALTYIPSNSLDYYIIKRNLLFLNYKDSSDALASIDTLRHFVTQLNAQNKKEVVPWFLFDIAATYFDIDYNIAYNMLKNMEIENVFFDNPYCFALLQADLSRCYFNKGQIQQAKNSLRTAQQIIEFTGENLNNLSALYYMFSLIYERENKLDSALIYARKSDEVKSQISSNLAAVHAYREYIITSLENSEQKVKLRNKQMVIVGTVSVLIVSVALLFLLLVRSRRKRIVAHLEYQEEIIDAKNREIASSSLLLSDKNNLLKQILELNGEGDARKIDEIIRSNFSVDGEWDNFKRHFEMVHPDFFTKLKQINPNLTEDNLRLCAYFKIGMSNKQIAQLLNCTLHSLHTRRSRLKIQLGVPQEEELNNWLRGI